MIGIHQKISFRLPLDSARGAAQRVKQAFSEQKLISAVIRPIRVEAIFPTLFILIPKLALNPLPISQNPHFLTHIND
jgi:hypothetical protein